MSKTRLLVVDDDRGCCRTLQLHFSSRGFDVETAGTADEGLAALERRPRDIVISDVRMPGRDGLSLLDDVRAAYPALPVIMITAFQDLDSTVAALHRGASDYVGKPIDIEELDAAVDRALSVRQGGDKDALELDTSLAGAKIVGRSRPIQEIFKAIGKVSQSRVTVLLTGESGTGKELIAQAIHAASADSEQPFIAVNCAALVETLLESELFGHERGAFTGAVSTRKGKAESAGEGVLFLDEVGELSPRMQGKLLRLLEAREFSPVGSDRPRTCRARFIAATNIDLEDKVARGEFREDLFYRLNVFSIKSPPLRERREDVPLLIEHLLGRIGREIHKNIRRITADAIEALAAYDWPGNVRQLHNVLMQSMVMAQGDTLTYCDLPSEIIRRDSPRGDGAPGVASPCGDPQPGLESLKDVERRHIEQVLEETGWHKGRTCEVLGISRPRLERRIREYGLVAPGEDHP